MDGEKWVPDWVGWGTSRSKGLGAKTLLRGVQLRVVVKGGGVCWRGWQGAWGTEPVCPAEGLSLARPVLCDVLYVQAVVSGPGS